MQEIRQYLETGQKKAGDRIETVNAAEGIKISGQETPSRGTPMAKEPARYMETPSRGTPMVKRPAEMKEESGQNRRYFRVRLTIAALLFLFFAAGIYFGCLPDWLTRERVREAFADNSLAQYLEEEAAKALASSDISKGEE